MPHNLSFDWMDFPEFSVSLTCDVVAAGAVLAVAVLLALAAELAGGAGRVAVDARPAGAALAPARRRVALGPVGALAPVLAVLPVETLRALLVASKK